MRLLLCLIAASLPAACFAQLAGRAEPLPGITTSAQPDTAALEALAGEGYVTVIDLRGPDEARAFDEGAAVEALGMTYVSLPVVGAEGLSYENAAALEAALAEARGPVLIHCSTGNRAGGLLALRQRLIGDDAGAALATGLEAGLSRPALIDVVETRLAEPLTPLDPATRRSPTDSSR